MDVEVNFKSGDYWVYQITKVYRIDKTWKFVSWQAYRKMLSTH